ncbi:MAG: toxin HicA [Mycobacterium sp.]
MDLLKEIRTFAKALGQSITVFEGANHTRVEVGSRRTVVARHSEINELTAKAIRKQLGMPQPRIGQREKGKP